MAAQLEWSSAYHGFPVVTRLTELPCPASRGEHPTTQHCPERVDFSFQGQLLLQSQHREFGAGSALRSPCTADVYSSVPIMGKQGWSTSREDPPDDGSL